MNFQDRVAQNPGRVKLTPVSGQNNVFDMTLCVLVKLSLWR